MDNAKPIDMLKNDHRKVEDLFSDFSHVRSEDHEKKKSILDDICANLKAHMKQEEEVFYPAIEDFSEEGKRLIMDGKQEHQEIKSLISGVENADMDGTAYDTICKRIESITNHHIREEESKVFPFAEKNISDQMGMGMAAKMMAIKAGKIIKEKIM